MLLSAGVTWAGEGGASLYMQGTYNDFAMALWGSSGFYMRDDVLFSDSSATEVPSLAGND